MNCVTKIALSCGFALGGVVCSMPARGYSIDLSIEQSTTDQRAEAQGQGSARSSDKTKGLAPNSEVFTVLHDDITCDPLGFTLSGAYTFTHCSTGQQISGTGRVRIIGATVLLTDRRSDRSVSAGYLSNQKTGAATITFSPAPGLWEVFRINQTAVVGPACTCLN